jgi:hypothetical protein
MAQPLCSEARDKFDKVVITTLLIISGGKPNVGIA